MLKMDRVTKIYRTDLVETRALREFTLHVAPAPRTRASA